MFINCSMNLQKNSIIVIQMTEGRKNLDDIKWMIPRFFGHSPQQPVFASL